LLRLRRFLSAAVIRLPLIHGRPRAFATPTANPFPQVLHLRYLVPRDEPLGRVDAEPQCVQFMLLDDFQLVC
jgi:hypothetical protein